GMTRLGLTALVQQVIPAEIMCPAAGQGALGIEIRRGDNDVRQQVSFLDDSAARTATSCERALLKKLGGGCQVPIGAFAEVHDDHIPPEAAAAHPAGWPVFRDSRGGRQPAR